MNALNPQPTRQDLLGIIDALTQRVALLERFCLPSAQDAESPAVDYQPTGKPLVFRDVVAAVAQAHMIDAAQIMNMGRHDRPVVRARFAVWLALAETHDWTQSMIARRFGCDHSTVGNGLRQARKLRGQK